MANVETLQSRRGSSDSPEQLLMPKEQESEGNYIVKDSRRSDILEPKPKCSLRQCELRVSGISSAGLDGSGGVIANSSFLYLSFFTEQLSPWCPSPSSAL